MYERLITYGCHAFWDIRNYGPQSCSHAAGKDYSFLNHSLV